MRDDVTGPTWRGPTAVLCAVAAYGALAVAAAPVRWLLLAPLLGLVASSLSARAPRITAACQLGALGGVAAFAPTPQLGFVVLAFVLLAIQRLVRAGGG